MIEVDYTEIEKRVTATFGSDAVDEFIKAIDGLTKKITPLARGEFVTLKRKQVHTPKKHIIRTETRNGRVWELHATKGWRSRRA